MSFNAVAGLSRQWMFSRYVAVEEGGRRRQNVGPRTRIHAAVGGFPTHGGDTRPPEAMSYPPFG